MDRPGRGLGEELLDLPPARALSPGLGTRGPCHCLWDMGTTALVSVSPRVLVTGSLGHTYLLAIVGFFGWRHGRVDVPTSPGPQAG